MESGMNGSTLTNSDYRIFNTRENTNEWERGKRDAEQVKAQQSKALFDIGK